MVGATIVGLMFCGWLIERNTTTSAEELHPAPSQQVASDAFVDSTWHDGDQQKYDLLGVKLGMDHEQFRANAKCKIELLNTDPDTYACDEIPSSVVDSGSSYFHFFNGKLIRVRRKIYWKGGDDEKLWRAFAARYGQPRGEELSVMKWGSKDKNGNVKKPYLSIDYSSDGFAVLQDPDAVAREQGEADQASRDARDRDQRAREDAVSHMK